MEYEFNGFVFPLLTSLGILRVWSIVQAISGSARAEFSTVLAMPDSTTSMTVIVDTLGEVEKGQLKRKRQVPGEQCWVHPGWLFDCGGWIYYPTIWGENNKINIRIPITLPEANMAPENGWLEDEFPFGKAYFQGLC